MTLSTLVNDTAFLLNDPNFTFISKQRVVRCVNEARRNAAKRTGCIRRMITGQSAFGASAQPGYAVPGGMQPGALPGAFPTPLPTPPPNFQGNPFVAGASQNTCRTIPGQERYPYQGFFLPYLKAQYAGVDQIYDTVTCAVNWGGTNRPVLDWQPWDDFQAYCRAYAVLNSSYPSIWSVFNDGPHGEIWMFPVPSTYGEIELDVMCAPSALNTDDDFDAIPPGMEEAIKYGAASIAYMGSFRTDNAQAMENQFADILGIARVSYDRGKSRSYYWSAI